MGVSILDIGANGVGAGVYVLLSLPVARLISFPGGALVCILVSTLVGDLTLLAMVTGPLVVALRQG